MCDRRPIALLICSILLFATPCLATSYPRPWQFVSESPNGKYRFAAVSGMHSPFSPDNALLLLDVETKETLWFYLEKNILDPDDGIPIRVFGAHVDNSGNVLVHDSVHSKLVPLAGPDGKIGETLSVRFEGESPQIPGSNHIEQRWRTNAFIRPIEIDGDSFLLIRSGSGARRLFGFTNNLCISELTPDQVASCEAAERRWAREQLRDAPQRLSQFARDCEVYDNQTTSLTTLESGPFTPSVESVRLAIWMTGRYAYCETIPELRAIERWRSAIPDQPGNGVSMNQHEFLQGMIQTFLPEVRMALRRLDEHPENFQPHTCMYVEGLEIQNAHLHPVRVNLELPERISFTGADVELVTSGMNVQNVIDTLGAPDSERHWGTNYYRFEFDIDADPPYTLRIESVYISDEPGLLPVTSVERISPPRWVTGAELDPYSDRSP